MPKLIKEIIRISLLSILLILPIFLWLNKERAELYWNIVQFNMRHLPVMKERKCFAVGSMLYLSPEVDIDTKFLEKDYPELLGKDKFLGIRVPQKDYPWSQYRLDKIALAPGGYFIAEISELRILPDKQAGASIIHKVVYRKNAAGEYSQIERCLKLMG